MVLVCGSVQNHLRILGQNTSIQEEFTHKQIRCKITQMSKKKKKKKKKKTNSIISSNYWTKR